MFLHPPQCRHIEFYELAALTAGTRMVAGSGRISAKGKEVPGEDVRRLIADIRNRTETAMSQAHCFKASELALKAQAMATRVGYLQG